MLLYTVINQCACIFFQFIATIKLLEKIFKDIEEKKEIKNFQVKKELKAGIGKVLNDTIILEPNIAGVGVNLNNLFKFLGGK